MRKIKFLYHLIDANGPGWFFLYALEILTGKISPHFYKKRIKYETDLRLPGFNSILYNYKEWNKYNWSQGGED